MAFWFKRRRPQADTPRLKPRGERSKTQRIDLVEITPDLLPYLGQVAYLQLGFFQRLSLVASNAPDLRMKEGIVFVSGLVLTKFQGLVEEIRRNNAEPNEVMQPFAVAIDGYQYVTTGSNWRETLLGVHVCAGLLDDFFIRLAEGMPGDSGPRAAALLSADAVDGTIETILRAEIEADPALGSQLALWGRRLVGDTLLVARSAVHLSGNVGQDDELIEPVFTEIIAAHTRRMDALGLTA